MDFVKAGCSASAGCRMCRKSSGAQCSSGWRRRWPPAQARLPGARVFRISARRGTITAARSAVGRSNGKCRKRRRTPTSTRSFPGSPRTSRRRARPRSTTVTSASATSCSTRRRDKVVAVLDWELATLGDPLADVAYSALAWRVTSDEYMGMRDKDLADLGIPSEHEYVAHYERLGARVGQGPTLSLRVRAVPARGDLRRHRRTREGRYRRERKCRGSGQAVRPFRAPSRRGHRAG